jgi:hypothetical protein
MKEADVEPLALDRYSLYEHCVQAPAELVGLLEAIHGGKPCVLGEDFCGTAALSREWVSRISDRRAVVVDHDREPLGRIRPHEQVTVLAGDVIEATTPPERHRADVIHAGNFSICEWHTRETLLRYLRHVRARLEPAGVFVCDLFGGETSGLVGSVDRGHPLPDGRIVVYTWEQRLCDPLTGRVVCAIHFEVDGQRLRDAFVYDWRLWGLPELREAMEEAGFSGSEVYRRTPEAVDDSGNVYVRPLEEPGDLDDSFDVLVAART